MSRPLRLLLAGSAIMLALVAVALSGGTLSASAGYDDAARRVLLKDWWTLWAIPPVEIALIVLLAATLAVAIRGAERRHAVAYACGAVAVLVLAVASPLAGLARGGMFAAHMTQHVLIGAVAPLLVLLSLPRAVPGDGRPRRRVLVFLLNPVTAFLIWTASTVTWLLPVIHHAVYMHQAAWITQQMSFFAFGIVMWAPITERLVAPPRWFGTGAKCLYMLGVWSVGLTLANVYWFAGSAFYPSHAAAAHAWGLSAVQDQANAATVMMTTHCMLAFGAIALLFFRQSREDGLEQRLIEAGLDPERVRWTVRYGDPRGLAHEAGVPLHTRGGID
jgi:cytochrome c oxidase assembly factor CtaG